MWKRTALGASALLLTAGSANAAALANAHLEVTFSETDGSMSVKVLDTGAVWTQTATTPYQASNVVAKSTSIQATLSRQGKPPIAATLTLASDYDLQVVLTEPSITAAYATLPTYPYPFTLPADTGYYVQNTSGDGVLFSLKETDKIVHMFDFIGVPWWGLTDFDKGMMAILDSPYRCAEDDNGRAAALLPATLHYVFFPKAGYVEMARTYRDRFLQANPAMTTLDARASKPGFANLKDGVYSYFWADARDGAFMKSVHDAGIEHAIATVYYGSKDLTDAQLATMFQAVKSTGWTAGMYTDPGGNLTNVAPGHWVDSVLTSETPSSFFDASQNWDAICSKHKAVDLGQTEAFVTLYGTTLGLDLAYFDTYVSQDAPCLDASHTQHNALGPPSSLPSPLEEERSYRLAFIDKLRNTVSAVGSGEGLAPAWAIPHLDFFEGSMMLRTYGENTQAIPGGGYADDFMPATNPLPPGMNTDETHRIPLFELMFHDRVASTWDWRDTNFQHLGTSRKKDLFNALYGTMPMWNMTTTFWSQHQNDFLDSYAFQKRSRSLIGFDDMIAHGFLSDDRELQYTDWASGIRIIANFDTNARTVNGQTIGALDFVVVQPASTSPDGGVDASTDPDGGATPPPPASSGCSCTITSTSSPNVAVFALPLLILWRLSRRPRASRKS